jgi:hypothetical protein
MSSLDLLYKLKLAAENVGHLTSKRVCCGVHSNVRQHSVIKPYEKLLRTSPKFSLICNYSEDKVDRKH